MKRNIILLSFVALGLFSSGLKAQASDPFIGQIAFVPYSFVPKGWAECDGQLLPINQNMPLFSLLGTTYGGNGTTNFALPDMRGKVIIDDGQGVGLSARSIGNTGGQESVTLTTTQMPTHSHVLSASTSDGDTNLPTNAIPANTKVLDKEYVSQASANTTMGAAMVQAAGGSESHPNMQPFLTLKCMIAIQGVFPSRN